MDKKTVHVPNISCGHCVKTIEREVGDMAGVAAVSAEQDSRRVTVQWDENATSWTEIRGLMEEINYPPSE